MTWGRWLVLEQLASEIEQAALGVDGQLGGKGRGRSAPAPGGSRCPARAARVGLEGIERAQAQNPLA